MAKPQLHDVTAMSSDEIKELRVTVNEYVTRRKNIENEIELLKTDLKELKEEFSEKVDMKTLEAALKVLKIENGVEHKNSFDLFVEALRDDQHGISE